MEGQFTPFSIDNTYEIQRLELALQSAGIGTWELDSNTQLIKVCSRTKALFGISGENNIPLEILLEFVHPDDRSGFRKILDHAINHSEEDSFHAEFRSLPDANGSPRWILCQGQKHFDGVNHSSKLLGSFINITQQVQNRQLTNENQQQQRIFQTIVEQAPMAIGFLSGPDMVVQVGNDRIFEVWGKDKSIIGLPLLKALPEIKDQVFLNLLHDVYTTGEPYLGSSMRATLLRNGKAEDIYFDFAYTPVRDNSNNITGVMVLATEVTAQVNTLKRLEESESKFRLLIEQAPVATCLFTGVDMIVELANQPMIGYWGKDDSVIGKPLREALPELVGQPFLDILDNIYKTGVAYGSKNAAVDIEVGGVLSTYYFNFTYKPIFDNNGKIFGIVNMSIDVTQQVLAQKALEESEAKLRSVIASAPAAMGLFVGRDLVIEMPNQTFIDIVGKGPDISGKPLREVMPELENQPFLKILDDVFTTGVMYESFGTQVDIVQNGVMSHNFYNITYTPILDNEGKVYAILDIAIDVTKRVEHQKQIEESQMQLLALFEQSPVGIAIIRKEGLTFTMANPFYGELVGRHPDEIIGKPLLEALPELKDQGFDKLLRGVIETGNPFLSKEQSVDIVRNNVLETIYVDLTYQPHRDMDGNINGVLVVATDLTRQVRTRKKIEQAEITLRGAVELAQLGTYEIDLVTRILTCSDRMKEWLGIGKDNSITIENVYAAICEEDLPAVQAGISRAIAVGSEGVLDMEYTLNPNKDGLSRVLHAQGKTIFNEKGEAITVIGTAQDVTIQRKVQLALELQVQHRTEELEVMNEEMAAINEEYMATNEELAESNNLLIQSNENLQQFAYVASHDLQEPLRKIQSFGNLLATRHSEALGDGTHYLQRMQSAAARMSNLIQDLLAFSKVSNRTDQTEPVSLTKVVEAVLTDLELNIQESGAVVTVGDLPVIEGDVLQLGQLFQNLISNALKFRKNDVAPQISITSQSIAQRDIAHLINPSRVTAHYYQIDVEDNGIGFDQQYADRIFQLFQRLHGRSEYSGTGIGLAICEKVIVNHGGAITVKSKSGEGTVFSLFFPK